MNRGLSALLQSAFPDVIPVPRPRVKIPKIIDPLWIGGFTSAEGCFRLKIGKSVTNKIGFKVELEFSLSQHARDEHVAGAN